MAWLAEADFNGLNNGTVVGQAGGSGWSNNWGDVGGTGALQVSGTGPYEGAKSLITTAGNLAVGRTLTTALVSGNTGVIYFAMKRSSISGAAEKQNITFRTTGDTAIIEVALHNNGNITSFATTILTGYSLSTWYALRVTYSMTARTFTVAYSTDAYGTAGTFSADTADITMGGAGSGDPAWVVLNTGDTGTVGHDYISATSPFTAAANGNFLAFM